MDKKTAAIKASLNQICDLFKGINSEDFRMLEIGFRHFAEHVVGMSAVKLLPALEVLAAEAATTQRDDLRISPRDKKGNILQVRDINGKWFGVSWADREPLSRANSDDVKVVDISFYEINPERWDYPYPERIGSSSIVFEKDRAAPFGHASLEEFGILTDAVRAFVAAAKLPLPPVDTESLHGSGFYTFSSHNAALASDDGVMGETCRQIGIEASKRGALLAMKWAAEMMPAVVEGLKNEGVVWDGKVLQFNDLDNTVCLMPTGQQGEVSIIHRNISYISDYRTYVLSRRGDGVLALYALKDGTDDFRKAKAAICDGEGAFEPIAILRDDKVEIASPFDRTCILDAMTHGLDCTQEIVVKGDRADADYINDFSSFDTRYEEDIEKEQSPAM